MEIADYRFYPSLVLRTPVYSYSRYQSPLAEILNDPFFKAAIFLASKSLYRELANANFNLAELNAKAKVALYKYFNRMCYRPTPFGLFSGISVTHWGASTAPLLLSPELKVHSSFSFDCSVKLANRLIDQYLQDDMVYQTNQSLYRTGRDYRYLRYEQNEGKRRYFIGSIEGSKVLSKVLDFCIPGKTRPEITGFISQAFDADDEESRDFLDQLIQEQVLVPVLQPNITGRDYLARVTDRCEAKGLAASEDNDVAAVKELSCFVSMINNKPTPEKMEPSSNQLLFVNLERPDNKGLLSESYQQTILDGLSCINKLLPFRQPGGLKRFADAFRKKFDRRLIPLLQALDPETGVGYESLESSHTSSALLRNISLDKPQDKTSYMQWTDAHSLLMKKWNPSESSSLILSQEDLSTIAANHSYALPCGISVLFRTMGEQVFIEQAGGANATSLIGRFTFFNEDISNMTRTIARRTEANHPDVIFAEIACISDHHTANIERRENIWSYEIPILTGSVMDKENQIDLSDLSVTVVEDRILLFSNKHQKIVVPLLSSAFNYVRNELSVFRFLCDLQHQGIRSDLNFSLSHFFPGFNFYPRVQYRNCILQLATWHITTEKVNSIILCLSLNDTEEHIRRLTASFSWPKYISLTVGDNQLVFDTNSSSEMKLFAESLKKGQPALVKEFPFAELEADVTDTANNPYINQFAASLFHNQKIYNGHTVFKQCKVEQKKRKFIPGSNWLYWKLYCHPSRANDLLTNELLSFAEKLRVKKMLKQWFYVRFKDPDFHLRIRLQLEDNCSDMVLALFRKAMEPFVNNGILQDIQVAVYERELERYVPEIIEEVETVFCASTDLLLHSLKYTAIAEEDFSYYKIAFSSLHSMMNVFGYAVKERKELFCHLHESLAAEFQVSANGLEQIKRKYRELKTMHGLLNEDLHVMKDPSLYNSVAAFENSLRAIVRKSRKWKAEKRRQLIADLMHMHLNRLFIDKPRRQEMVVYYCLCKHYESQMARAKYSML